MNLIVIYGAPAAGKLTVAKQLARMTGYKLFDNHAIVTPLGKIFGFKDPTLNDIRAKLGRRIRLDVMNEAASAGISMITTAAASGEIRHNFFRDIKQSIEKRGGKVLLVQLLPSTETLLERVTGESRYNVKTLNTPEQLKSELLANPDMFETFPDVPHLIIDNSDLSPENVATQIVKYYSLGLNK